MAAVLTLILALAACGDNVFGPEPTDVEFAASLGIDLAAMTQTASGLYVRDDVVGTGPLAAAFDQVTVMYTGWLVDGEQFDSGELTATIGSTALIDGFTEGLLGMQAGGMRTIVIPASLGYGSQGAQAGAVEIPSDAVLVFALELTVLVKAPG